MNRTGKYFLFFVLCLLLLCCLLSGCGSAPAVHSDTHIREVEFNQQADSAFRIGEYKKALDFYEKALQASSSIEYEDGIAINLMDMAAVYRKLGDKENAHRCLDDILNSRHIIFDPSHLSGASYIKAVLFADSGNYPSAIEWSDKALSFCSTNRCAEKGRIYNLKARISLATDAPDEAVAFAMQGLDLNRKQQDKQEEANSLRLLADAKMAGAGYEEAKKFYMEALEIDKTIGAASKISMDLTGVANVFCKQGRQEDAAVYFKRVQSVIKSSGADKETAVVKPPACVQ